IGDTPRRVLPIRLESPLERPEERTGFRYPNLRAHVLANRGPLLSAALTILRAYCVAGRPDQGLTPWGGFEGWSDLVRNTVVWCGLPDRGVTRAVRQRGSSPEPAALADLYAGIARLCPPGKWLKTEDIIEAYKFPGSDPRLNALKGALDTLRGLADKTGTA